MMNLKRNLLLTGAIFMQLAWQHSDAQTPAPAQHRPAFHFSPRQHWMNDPNGMYFNNGTYHLFFQYYPDGTKWGPMHWGHTTSKDMIHWEEQPIALYPDSLGYIFSGSVVIDKDNTSGLGVDGKTPIVAIFTHHNLAGEQAKRNDFQNQSIAYSLDNGKAWVKYGGNPVLKNPGIVDFRDPKVMWYEKGKKWVMTLATKDHISFYSSPDLKNWTKESEFGHDLGAHGGVWECPDLFELNYKGKNTWVLLVSINPGGPNGGSGTQYFLGDFDGNKFTPADTLTRWMDYGTDNYAGVTFFNTTKRTILMGWMSNWQYAQDVPTEGWRSGNTLPRELTLAKAKDKLYLASVPVREVSALDGPTVELKNIRVSKTYEVSAKINKRDSLFKLQLSVPAEDFSLVLSNALGEELVIGYSQAENQYYIDRSKAGKVAFEPGFGRRHTAPRIAGGKKIDLTLFVDVASVELFADRGLSVMTDLFFPNQPLSTLALRSEKGVVVKKLVYTTLNRVAQ